MASSTSTEYMIRIYRTQLLEKFYDSTMFLFVLIILLFAESVVSLEQTIDEQIRLSNKVREYFLFQQQETRNQPLTDTTWLVNSNKLGLGYNPVTGDPVCYTGACQMAGFGRSVFKFNYTNAPTGSCTTKLIPEHVEIDCLPSLELGVHTTMISNVNELYKSQSSGWSVKAGLKIKLFGASYERSEQTTNILDDIYKRKQFYLYTQGKIALFKLALFEPKIELSDNFRYVIENMPLGTYNDIIDEYIRTWILEYFGYTYVTDILLGGIAQQTLTIDQSNMNTLNSQTQSVTDKAKVSFFVSLGGSKTDSTTQTEQQEFMKMIKTAYTTTLGGKPHANNDTLNDWYASVASNPIVTNFVVAPIVDLLTQVRFPNDSKIVQKVALIKQAWTKYVNVSVFCYDNCTDSTHGQCITTGYFNFGLCSCFAEWNANPLDCSESIATTANPFTTSILTKMKKKQRVHTA